MVKASFLHQLFVRYFLMKFLKATFHLQLLQTIGCVSCIVQYILEPVLYSNSAHPMLPLSPSPLVTTSLFSVSLLFCYVY